MLLRIIRIAVFILGAAAVLCGLSTIALLLLRVELYELLSKVTFLLFGIVGAAWIVFEITRRRV